MANLTPEQLRAIQQSGGRAPYVDPATGKYYFTTTGYRDDQPSWAITGDPSQDANRYRNETYEYSLTPEQADSIKGGKKAGFNGVQYSKYGDDGSFLGSDTFTGFKDDSLLDKLMPLLPVLGFGIPTALAHAGLIGMPGAAASGAAGGGSGLTGGGFVGEGLHGAGVWTEAGGLAGGGAAAGGAAGAAGAGLGAGGSALGAGAAGLGSAALGGIGSALSGLGGLLGPGAALLGAALGSKPNEQTQTQTRDLPEYLKGPVINDLIPRTQGLLASQMPIAQQTGDALRQKGMGLLNAPIAGNGFTKFFGG